MEYALALRKVLSTKMETLMTKIVITMIMIVVIVLLIMIIVIVVIIIIIIIIIVVVVVVVAKIKMKMIQKILKPFELIILTRRMKIMMKSITMIRAKMYQISLNQKILQL